MGGLGQFIGLDALTHALGLPSPRKASMDGSRVFDAWQAGHDDIAAYNLKDARAVAAVAPLANRGGRLTTASAGGDKGKSGERELARLLSELTGRGVRRRVRNLAG